MLSPAGAAARDGVAKHTSKGVIAAVPGIRFPFADGGGRVSLGMGNHGEVQDDNTVAAVGGCQRIRIDARAV